MTEKTLYKILEDYNLKIENKFKENWGSLLSYLETDN